MSELNSEHQQLKSLLDAQQWDKALDLTFEMLKTQPHSSWLHLTMGNIYHKMNELGYAVTSMNSAIYYQDTNVEAHTSLGFIYLAMGRVGAADDQCRNALAIDETYTPTWHLGLKIKLIFSDIHAAREIHAKLSRQGVDEQLLRSLDFEIIRHPLNKQEVDHQTEIHKRKNYLSSDSPDHAIHAELAYLYDQYTDENKKAQQHIETALQKFTENPGTIATYALIQRKSSIWLRALTAPMLALTRPKQTPLNDLVAVRAFFIILLGFILLSPLVYEDVPWLSMCTVFTFIISLFISYTSFQAFLYLITTEIYHQHNKTKLLKGALKSMHLLPYKKRIILICSLTLVSWCSLAALLYSLTQ